jgi:glutamate--cysteine ligase
MRGADGGRWRRICALPAFCAGLLYDDAALEAAWRLVKDWRADERQSLRNAVPKLAMDAPFHGGTVRDLARDVLQISSDGLKNRRRLDSKGRDERMYLEPLNELVASGKTVADELLDRYHGAWAGNIDHVFEEIAF